MRAFGAQLSSFLWSAHTPSEWRSSAMRCEPSAFGCLRSSEWALLMDHIEGRRILVAKVPAERLGRRSCSAFFAGLEAAFVESLEG